jgi:cytochrome c551/c552
MLKRFVEILRSAERKVRMKVVTDAVLATLTTTLFAQAPAALTISAQQALVNQYCVTCHNDKLRTGGFSWTRIDLAHPEKNLQQAEKVVLKLRAGMMPPAGAPRPNAAQSAALATSIENAIDKAAEAHPYAGAPDLHRLNRTEYRNSIRDLLDLDVDVSSMLPPDDMSHGFDNMADALTITPAVMQGYVRAAGKISRLALGDAQVTPYQTAYNVPKVVNQRRHVDGAPFGTRGGISVVHQFPADGAYKFSITLYYYYLEQLFGVALPANLTNQQIEISVDGARVWDFPIDPKTKETQASYVTSPISVKAGPHRVTAAFLEKGDGPIVDTIQLYEQTLIDVSTGIQPGMTTLPHLHTLTITGPLNVTGVSETPSRQKIFVCHPESEIEQLPCAKKIIAKLGRQAFRHPLNDADVERLLSEYQYGRNEGSFDSGIRMAVQAILSDPQFVFRFERDPAGVAPGTNYRLSDLELASRLSYFLWSSAPDDELLSVASENKLHQSEVLNREVLRMLANPKSDALAKNFASEWLHLQNLKEVDPDGVMFPNFTRNLALSMLHETQLLFGSIMHEDRDVKDLLTANYTFVDEVLAKHYGIPNVAGNTFRRITLTDPNRFGLLGQASILTLTSQANRTSPVQRGKYVMEVLLGAPPPNPPPNVPPLKENVNNEKQKSVRERMEEHRSVEPCASCHKMMDPIGLALENYDAVGVWREKDSGIPIDGSGKMYDGTKLNGPVSVREAVLAHADAFLRNFAANLLSYGVGRVLDYRDMPAVRGVEREAAKNNNRFSAFVLGVVKSVPFQMRSAEGAPSSDSAAQR